jgi:hypothetical protein
MMRLLLWYGNQRVTLEGEIEQVLREADRKVVEWQSA